MYVICWTRSLSIFVSFFQRLKLMIFNFLYWFNHTPEHLRSKITGKLNHKWKCLLYLPLVQGIIQFNYIGNNSVNKNSDINYYCGTDNRNPFDYVSREKLLHEYRMPGTEFTIKLVNWLLYFHSVLWTSGSKWEQYLYWILFYFRENEYLKCKWPRQLRADI